MRHFFFAINISGTILFLVACVYSIGSMESPGSFMGGVAFFTPTAALGIAEWFVWYRKRRDVEKVLGWVYAILAGLAVFGVIANIGEAFQRGWPEGFGWFVAIGMTIASYFLFCGIYRIVITRNLTTGLPPVATR